MVVPLNSNPAGSATERLLHYTPPTTPFREETSPKDPLHAGVSRFTFREDENQPKQEPTTVTPFEGFDDFAKKDASEPIVEKPPKAPTRLATGKRSVAVSERKVSTPPPNLKPSFTTPAVSNFLQRLGQGIASFPTWIQKREWPFKARATAETTAPRNVDNPFIFKGPQKISDLLQKGFQLTQILRGARVGDFLSQTEKFSPKIIGMVEPTNVFANQAILTVAGSSATVPTFQRTPAINLYSFLLTLPSPVFTPNARSVFLNPDVFDIKKLCGHHLQGCRMMQAPRTPIEEEVLREAIALTDAFLKEPRELAKFITLYYEWSFASTLSQSTPKIPTRKRRIKPTLNEDVLIVASNLIHGAIRVFKTSA